MEQVHQQVHPMVCEADNAREALFACAVDGCGRRVVVGKAEPAFTVIDRGHAHIRHSGAMGGLLTSVGAEQ